MQAVQGEVEELNGAVVAAFEAYRQQRPQVEGALREARRLADAAGRPQEDLPLLPDGPPEVARSLPAANIACSGSCASCRKWPATPQP